MAADASKYYKEKYGDTGEPVPRDPNERGVLKYTLFSKSRPSYGMFFVDEAHQLRILNKAHMGAMGLGGLAAMTIAMTATPMVTGPQVRRACGGVSERGGVSDC